MDGEIISTGTQVVTSLSGLDKLGIVALFASIIILSVTANYFMLRTLLKNCDGIKILDEALKNIETSLNVSNEVHKAVLEVVNEYRTFTQATLSEKLTEKNMKLIERLQQKTDLDLKHYEHIQDGLNLLVSRVDMLYDKMNEKKEVNELPFLAKD